jgi:hypothetical protein
MMKNDLRMSDLLPRLRADYGDAAPSYQMMLRKTTEGRVPAFRHGNGPYRYRATDYPAICAGLGLPPIGEAQTTA